MGAGGGSAKNKCILWRQEQMHTVERIRSVPDACQPPRYQKHFVDAQLDQSFFILLIPSKKGNTGFSMSSLGTVEDGIEAECGFGTVGDGGFLLFRGGGFGMDLVHWGLGVGAFFWRRAVPVEAGTSPAHRAQHLDDLNRRPSPCYSGVGACSGFGDR